MKKIFSYLLFFSSLYGLKVGSETSSSVQVTSITFPQVDSNNEVLGFVAINAGFNLENAKTTCTFNALFPVSGKVSLNRGTLFLKRDLIFTDTGRLSAGGRIEGFNKSIIFPSTINTVLLPNDAIKTFSLVSRFTDIAAVKSLDWSFNSSYIITGLQANASDEVVLLYFDGASLTETNQIAGTNTVSSVRWHPNKNFFTVTRLAGVDNELQVHFLNTNNGSIINGDVLNFTFDFYATEWHPTGSYITTCPNFGTAELVTTRVADANGGSLGALGLLNLPGTTAVVREDALSWGPLGNNYLAAGLTFTSITGPQLLICSLTQAANPSLTITTSATIGANVTAVDWSPTGSFIAIGVGAAGTERLRIYEHTVQNGRLIEATSARVGATSSVFAVDWSVDGNSLAVGLESNSSTELRLYDFNKTNKTLTLQAAFDTFTTVSTVKFSPNGRYIAVGDAAFNTSVYDFSSELVFKNTRLVFNSDATIRAPVVIEGNCTIDGNGFIIGLDPGGSFSISAGAKLTLSNLTVTGLLGNRIISGSNSSSLVMKNTSLILSGDYTFSRGTILFQEDNLITGSNKFIYTTPFGSTIDTASELLIDSGVTFSYGPTAARNNLINMVDKTSILHLNSCTLHVTFTGLQLTKGTLILEGAPIFVSNARNLPEGISFGDGLSSANDLNLDVQPGVPLDLRSGFLNIKNILS